MNYAVLTSSLMFLALGCGGRRAASTGSAPQPAPQQAAVPPVEAAPHGFKVNLKLSDKAMRKLVQSKETVIVAGYLSGNPKKGAQKKYIDEIGMVELGEIRTEVAPGENASFGEVKLPQDLLAQTDGKDPQLLINVFSGRKSSPNNLLDCGIYEGGLTAIQGRSTDIACKLIAE